MFSLVEKPGFRCLNAKILRNTWSYYLKVLIPWSVGQRFGMLYFGKSQHVKAKSVWGLTLLIGVIGVYLGRVTILDASLRVPYSRPSVFSASVRPSLFAPQSNLLSLPPAHWGWRLSAATRQQFPEAWPFNVSYINGPWLVVDVLCLLTLLECFGKDDTKNLWEQSPIVPRSKASLSYVARFKV